MDVAAAAAEGGRDPEAFGQLERGPGEGAGAHTGIEAIRWINPIVADWVDSQNDFKEHYAKKFSKKRPQSAPTMAAAAPIPEE